MSTGFLKLKQDLPTLGVGLGLRREIAEETMSAASRIDWLEIVPENYMELGGRAKERLHSASSLFPLVSHGVNLSIGSTDDLNYEYLKALKNLLDEVDAPWWSDHLCFTSVDGTYLHDLLPVPFSKEAVNHIVERVKRVQDYVGRPFLLENISFYMNMPGCEMSDAQFMSEILERSDCGLLLDVNNVYVNSVNHGFDPREYINQIPLERTVQMHVAGHKRINDYIIDTHGAPVIEPVYELLKYVVEKTTVNAILLERDQNFPSFDDILAEIDHIKRISSIQPAMAAAAAAAAARQGSVPKSGQATGHATGQGSESRLGQDSKTERDGRRPVKGGRDLRALSA